MKDPTTVLLDSLQKNYQSERLQRLQTVAEYSSSVSDEKHAVEKVIAAKGSINVTRIEPSRSIKPRISAEHQEIRHQDDRFFTVQFFDVHTDANREETEWIQPLIVEKNQPAGILGQIVACKGNNLYWLLQVKSEPGDIKGFNLTTTIQATLENIRAPNHLNRVPCLPVFLDAIKKETILFSFPVQEDGGRYFRKLNHLVAVEIEFDHSLENKNLIWLEHSSIVQMFKSHEVPLSAQLRFMMCQFLV